MRIVRWRCRDAISESFQPLAEANQMCESPSLDGEVDAEGGGWGEDLGVISARKNVAETAVIDRIEPLAHPPTRRQGAPTSPPGLRYAHK